MTRVNLTIDPSVLCDQHLIAETREIARLPFNFINRKTQPPQKFTLGTGHVLYCTQLLDHCHKRFIALQSEMKRRGFTSNLTWNKVNHPKDIKFVNINEASTLLKERIIIRYPKNARYFSKPISLLEYTELINNSVITLY